MKTEYVKKLIDMILEQEDEKGPKLKELLQKGGVDVDRWRERVRRYLREWERGRAGSRQPKVRRKEDK